jgi:hypothetical protein
MQHIQKNIRPERHKREKKNNRHVSKRIFVLDDTLVHRHGVMDRIRHTIIYVFQHDDVTCHLTFILGNILFLLLRTYYIGEAAVNLLHMTIDNVIYT